MIVCGTGHRPEDSEDEQRVRRKARDVFTTESIDIFINGAAAGFDLWAADEALSAGIEVWTARPWSTHGPRTEDVELYARVIDGSSRVVVVTETDEYPGPWVYHKRNEWMVDNADNVLAYWSGKERGGTYACIKYARKVGKPIRNIYGKDL